MKIKENKKAVQKIKIKIGIIGSLPFYFNWESIKKWKSEVFEIVGDIEEYENSTQCVARCSQLIENGDANFFIGITYESTKDHYTSYLNFNIVILSYFKIYNILKQEHIPIENLLLRAIYGYVLIYLRRRNIPVEIYPDDFHKDTRGCILDKNVIHKPDVIFSLDHPKICKECIEEMKKHKVSDNYIKLITKELLRIKKECFYEIVAIIKTKLISSFILTTLLAILVNLIASMIWDIEEYRIPITILISLFITLFFISLLILLSPQITKEKTK